METRITALLNIRISDHSGRDGMGCGLLAAAVSAR